MKSGLQKAGFIALGIVLVILSGTGFAQEKQEAEKSPWKGEAEIGYLLTTGNTETQTLNAKLDFTREVPRWRHNLRGETIYSSEESNETGEEETTAQKLLVSAKTNFKFDPKNSIFVLGLYEDDRFSGYAYQVSTAAGYSRQIIDTDRMTLSAEIGPGFRYSKIKDESKGDDESEGIVLIGGEFEYKLSESASFAENLSVEAGMDKTITRSTTSLKAQIVGQLAMKASFAVKYTDSVPVGTKKTETETALTLVYSF